MSPGSGIRLSRRIGFTVGAAIWLYGRRTTAAGTDPAGLGLTRQRFQHALGPSGVKQTSVAIEVRPSSPKRAGAAQPATPQPATAEATATTTATANQSHSQHQPRPQPKAHPPPATARLQPLSPNAVPRRPQSDRQGQLTDRPRPDSHTRAPTADTHRHFPSPPRLLWKRVPPPVRADAQPKAPPRPATS